MWFGRHPFTIYCIETHSAYFLAPHPTLLDCPGCHAPQAGLHVSEYEFLFGFNCHCADFNPDTVVRIDKKMPADGIKLMDWIDAAGRASDIDALNRAFPDGPEIGYTIPEDNVLRDAARRGDYKVLQWAHDKGFNIYRCMSIAISENNLPLVMFLHDRGTGFSEWCSRHALMCARATGDYTIHQWAVQQGICHPDHVDTDQNQIRDGQD
jgi:hypothetical protein